MNYIDADKLKAEIDEMIDVLNERNDPDPLGTTLQCMAAGEIEAFGMVKDIIEEMKTEGHEHLNNIAKEID